VLWFSTSGTLKGSYLQLTCRPRSKCNFVPRHTRITLCPPRKRPSTIIYARAQESCSFYKVIKASLFSLILSLSLFFTSAKMANSGAESSPGHANRHAKLSSDTQYIHIHRWTSDVVVDALAHRRKGPLKVYSLQNDAARRLSRTRGSRFCLSLE